MEEGRKTKEPSSGFDEKGPESKRARIDVEAVERKIEEVEVEIKEAGKEIKDAEFAGNNVKAEQLHKEKEQLWSLPPSPVVIVVSDRIPVRTDPRFAHLRNLEQLRANVGKVIALPLFPETPKGFNYEDADRILLTPARFALAEEMWRLLHLGQAEVANKSPETGFILSGSNGVGKSIVSYLLVSILYVNGAIVTYIPRCATWVADSNPKRYFVYRIIQLNRDVLASMPCKSAPEYRSLLQLAEAAYHGIEGAYETLLDELYYNYEQPFVVGVDEHNEIYKVGKELDPFFRGFTIATALLSGRRTFGLLSGSAHSKFELHLQSSLKRWLRHIRPFEKEMFEAACFGPDPIIPLPKSLSKARVAEATGRTPRILVFLQRHLKEHPDDGLEDWVREYTLFLKGEFDKFVVRAKAEGRIDSVKTFVNWFVPQTEGSEPSIGSFWDAGLVFRDDQGQFLPICESAMKVIVTFWAQEVSLPLLSTVANESERGAVFEQWVIRRLAAPTQRLEAFILPAQLNKDGSPTPTQIISLSPNLSIRYFSGPADIEPNAGIQELYLPTSRSHKAWDMILHNPHSNTIIFIQVSISSLRSHDLRDKIYRIKNSIDIGQVSQLISSITCHQTKVSLDPEGNIKVDPPSPLCVYFMYVTSLPCESIIRGESKLKPQTPRYEGLLVMAKEQCESSLRIPLS